MRLSLVFLITLLTACSNPPNSEQSSPQSQVTIQLASAGQSSKAWTAGDISKQSLTTYATQTTTPSNVQSLSVQAFNAENIPLTSQSIVNAPNFTLGISVPNGADIRFKVLAFSQANAQGNVLYSGSATATLTGTPITLPVVMSLNIMLSATPSTNVFAGNSITLSALVGGTTPSSSSAVLWSATAGSFTGNVWTAPNVPGAYTITGNLDPAIYPEQDAGIIGSLTVNVSSPATAGSQVPFTVVYSSFAADSYAATIPVAGATIVVDAGGPANTFTTDTNGQALIPNVDTGLHNVHVFSDIYPWLSIYEFTANPAGNTLLLQPGNNANNVGSMFTIEATLPPTTILPANTSSTQINLMFTDNNGNRYQDQAFDIGAMGSTIVSSQIFTGTPTAASISGMLTAKVISCDPYGFNCTQTDIGGPDPITVTTAPAIDPIAPITSITLSAPASPTSIAVANTTDSELKLDVSFINSSLSTGATHPSTELVIADIQLQIMVGGVLETFTAKVSPTTSAVDLYGNVTVTGAANLMAISLPGIPPGSSISNIQVIEKVETFSPSQISETNYVDLGSPLFTTTATPLINNFLQPSTANPALTVTFTTTPPSPTPLLNVQAFTPPPSFTLNTILISDQAGYSNTLPSTNPIPYTFASMQNLSGPFTIFADALGPISANLNWIYNASLAKGSILSHASLYTALPQLAPGQSGGVINYNFASGSAVNVGKITLRDFAGHAWQIMVNPQSTSITLPATPAGVVNPWLSGVTYDLSFESAIFSGFTYNTYLNAFYNASGIIDPALVLPSESIGSVFPVNYTR